MPVPCFALAKSRVAKVVCAEIECGQECGEALITISDSIERWEKQLQLFPTNQDIFASVSKLFARILQYLVRATLHLSSPYPARTVWVAFGGASKFTKILASIQRCASSLDSEFGTASEASQSLEAGSRLDACRATQIWLDR
jgi:hypothetical protein